MSSDGSIRRRLETIFRAVFEVDDLELTRDTSSATIDAWDSLSLIVLLTAIEAEFGVRFGGEDMAALESVGTLEDFLAREAHM